MLTIGGLKRKQGFSRVMFAMVGCERSKGFQAVERFKLGEEPNWQASFISK